MPKSTTLCVDANLVISLLAEQGDGTIRVLWDSWGAAGHHLAAPLQLRYEATNAFHRYARAGVMSSERAQEAIESVVTMPIALHTDEDLHLSALEFAARFNLPAAYDAHYLALAAKLGTGFWTADRRLANTVQPHLGWVQLAG
jgi:predicted nucleic acid-binding protein